MLAGLGYRINAVDEGANIIKDVASLFVARHDSNPRNASYVDNLYQNILHRAGESGGVAYWQQQLNTRAATKAFVLEQIATFSEGGCPSNTNRCSWNCIPAVGGSGEALLIGQNSRVTLILIKRMLLSKRLIFISYSGVCKDVQ